MRKTALATAEVLRDSNTQEDSVRRELNRILKSRTFRQVERLQKLLSYIVEETLSGQTGGLKEYVLGVDVFERGSEFDPRMDPIVRVQARRLRIRLEVYYRDEGQTDDVVIELPKGGYTPHFRRSKKEIAKRPMGAALAGRNTIAVLPFADNSTTGERVAFCAGLSHQIVNALTKEESIIVVSRELSAGDAADTSPSSALIVSGDVRESHGVLRITMHLSDVVRGCYIWSHAIDSVPNDVFAVQEEVAKAVLERVRIELAASSERAGGRRGRENLAAHNMYLKGLYHLNQRTEQGLRQAVECFSHAISEDPQLAQAYAGLADADNLLAHYGVLAPADVWTKAASNAAQAVRLNDDSAEAHTSLAHVKATQDWDWLGSEVEFKRAIYLDPRYAAAHHWYAVSCLTPLARLDEALEEMLLAKALDPVSSIIRRDIALNHYYRRDFESALEECDHTIEENPHFSAAYWTLGLVQEQRGDLDEAVAALRRAIDLAPPSLRILGSLGRALAQAGKKDEALAVLGELRDLSTKRYISPFEFALIHFALKRKDEGFEFLTKAFQDRCYELTNIKIDPRFDAVSKDSRFAELIAKIGLP